MQRLWILIWLLFLQPASVAMQDVAELAYRRGDWPTAQAEYLSQLEAGPADPVERARLCYNLGNVHYRAGELTQAVGWYSAALRHAPRDADIWHNLELARSEAGLEPADRGDLADTTKRLFLSLTLTESEYLVATCLALLALCLAGEALRGGRAWRRLAWAAGALVLLACGPWLWNLSRTGGAPMMVVASEGAPTRTHPGQDAETVGTLAAGSEVEKLDEWPGWVKVLTPAGTERWVQEKRLFDLDR